MRTMCACALCAHTGGAQGFEPDVIVVNTVPIFNYDELVERSKAAATSSTYFVADVGSNPHEVTLNIFLLNPAPTNLPANRRYGTFTVLNVRT